MSEQSRSVQEILDELHAALESAPEIGDVARDALRQAVDDIRAALDEPGREREESLADQLSQAVDRFEQAHPQLTSIVGRVADALSDIGI
jgi:F0F1-type ATP synthase membrane subunit b/b'